MDEETKNQIKEKLMKLKNPKDNLRCTLGYAKQYCIGREEIEAIEIALDIIEKQDLHIEHWKNGFERELESNRTNTLELLDQDQKIKKQEKIIELMARYIAGLDIEEDICCKTPQYGECDQMAYGECERCIKKHFEREVEKC